MLLLRYSVGRLLPILLSILQIVFAVPDLGIQRDFVTIPGNPNVNQNGVVSYSGIIKFDDLSIPGDKSKMSDAQFINLAQVAYNEMLAIWATANENPAACPGAMVAMESEGYMYFASSVRDVFRIDWMSLDEGVVGSPGDLMSDCLTTGGGAHMYGGQCAEPNVLRLYGTFKGLASDDPPTYKAPPTTDTSPRLAVWGRPTTGPNQGQDPRNVQSFYFTPCSPSINAGGIGYGCKALVSHYGLKAVPNVAPVTDGQDGWTFSNPANPRNSCG